MTEEQKKFGVDYWPFIILLQTFLMNSPENRLTTTTVVRRGMRLSAAQIEEYKSYMTSGKVLHWRAFTSTSTGSGFRGVRFDITISGHCLKMASLGAIDIARISAHSSEKEVLLATDIPVRVESVRNNGSETQIGVRVDELELYQLNQVISNKCREYLKRKAILKGISEKFKRLRVFRRGPPRPIAGSRGRPILVWRANPSSANLSTLRTIRNTFLVRAFHRYDRHQALSLVTELIKSNGSAAIHVASDRGTGGREFAIDCQRAGIASPIVLYCLHTENWEALPGVSLITSESVFVQFVADFAKTRDKPKQSR
jgi:hypothetical protein